MKYNRCLEALRRSALEKDRYSPAVGKNMTLDMVCQYSLLLKFNDIVLNM